MKLIEMIEVMMHYEKGGEIECERQKDNKGKWTPTCSPSWNWTDYNYRIEEPKQKITIEKWLCRSEHGEFVIIESTNVDKFKMYEKVKLMGSYEVEF